MTDSLPFKQALRTPAVFVPIAVAVVVILIWLFVFFLPQGSKLSKLDTQEQSLQQQEARLNAQLAALRHINASALTQLRNEYTADLPPTVDNTGYLKLINNAVAQAGVTLISFTPGAVTGTPVPLQGTSVIPISVTLQTSGTYDSELRLMQLLYKLPRLTTIDQIEITGGGPDTSRTTSLAVDYTMTIYEAPAVSGTTTPTS